jgi:hypothetical protein
MSTFVAYALLLTVVPFIGMILGSLAGTFLGGLFLDNVLPPKPGDNDTTANRTNAIGAMNGCAIAGVTSILAYWTFELLDLTFSSTPLWVLFGWFLINDLRRVGLAGEMTRPLEMGVMFGTLASMLGIILGLF